METKSLPQETWILKRINEKNIGKKKIFQQKEIDGELQDVEIGEFEDDGLPGMADEIVPRWDALNKRWAWGGSDQDLNRIVKELGLYNKKGDLITHASLSDYTDPFITHKRFREAPEKMYKIYTFKNDATGEFLRLCWKGWDKVLTHGNEDNISKAELSTKEYLLILSTNLETMEKKVVDKKIEAIAKLYGMTIETKNLICVICQESYQIGLKDGEITPKIVRIAENSNTLVHPQNKNLYNSKTSQDVLIEYAEKDLKTLTMAAKIIMAINREEIRYSNTGYKYQGKLIGEGLGTLDELLNYYTSNEDEFTKLDIKVKL